MLLQTACVVGLAWLSSPGPRRHGGIAMGTKKTSFVPYVIDHGDTTRYFPLPEVRDAVGVHKKHSQKGTPASKLAKGKDRLLTSLPGLDLSWPALRILHLDPPVLVVDNFFSAEECDAYAALRDGGPEVVHELEQSATFSAASASARTSTTWFAAYQSTATFLARAAALMGIDDLRRFEEPQLVRYRSGQYFSWHYDAVPKSMLLNGGQRLATLLVYLNDVPAGGRTAFRDLRAGGTDETGKPLRLQVAPRKGRALLFFPSLEDGTPDDRTLHAGEPTAQGEDKWVAQLWTHERAYKPSVPAGSSQEAAAAAVKEAAAREGLRFIADFPVS
jgi:hypothetical protein